MKPVLWEIVKNKQKEFSWETLTDIYPEELPNNWAILF